MAIEIPDDIELRVIDRCIYCGNDGSCGDRLTREHIVPLSLNGYHTIGRASCDACSDITSANESQCCDLMFESLRVHHKARSRKGRWAKVLKIIEGLTPHNAPVRALPADQVPGVTVFPILQPPAIITGRPPDRIEMIGYVVCPTTEDAVDRQRKLIAGGMKGALATTKIPFGQFAKTLAKIAHGFVVSQVGLDAFKPLLQEVILGKSPDIGYYVGGLGGLPPNMPEATKPYQIYPFTTTIHGVDYIAVQIRLFAYVRPTPPIYLVIVGEYSGPKGGFHPIFFR